MFSYQNFCYYYEKSQEKISLAAKYVWDSYYFQAALQGLAAPLYSYESIKKMWESSEGVRSAVTRTFKLNGKYALQGLVCTYIYQTQIHDPAEEWRAEYNHSNSYFAPVASFAICSFDVAIYCGIQVYLVREMMRNVVQNCANTSTIALTAAMALPSSEHFKACDCSSSKKMLGDIYSLVFYMVNRWGVRYVSDGIRNLPNYGYKVIYCGEQAASFALEAFGVGWPLIEYKSAIGRCSTHRYEELFQNKAYFIWFGACFLTATWATNYVLSIVPESNNRYTEDAVFNFMFQMFIITSIARRDPFPGYKGWDFFAALKEVLQTPIAQYLLKEYLAELSSIEKVIQSPGPSLLLSVRDDEIKDSLNSLKGGLNAVQNVRTKKWFSVAKWTNKWFSLVPIPKDVKKFFKENVTKRYLNDKIGEVERLLELSRTAEAQRNASKELAIMNEGYIAVSPNVPNGSLNEKKEVVHQEQINSTDVFLSPHNSLNAMDELLFSEAKRVSQNIKENEEIQEEAQTKKIEEIKEIKENYTGTTLPRPSPLNKSHLFHRDFRLPLPSNKSITPNTRWMQDDMLHIYRKKT